jgi:hypothetical protein
MYGSDPENTNPCFGDRKSNARSHGRGRAPAGTIKLSMKELPTRGRLQRLAVPRRRLNRLRAIALRICSAVDAVNFPDAALF